MADGIGPIEGLKLEAKKMKEMTWHQRWVQFRTYWLWKTLLLLLALFAAGSLTWNFFRAQRDVVISGALVNIGLSEAGQDHVTEDYMVHLGVSDWTSSASVAANNYIDFTSGDITYENTVAWQSLYAMLSARDLDYLFLEEDGLRAFGFEGIFANLEEVLSPETLSLVRDRLSEIEVLDPETQETVLIPAAIHMEGTEFAEVWELEPEDCWLVLVINGRNLENADDFIRFLFEENGSGD